MKKSPNDADRNIGSRMRARRIAIGMSQEKLGDMLGLTFQQVQKYEKGVNRVGAGRLLDIAAILQVPVAYFYEGLPTGDGKDGSEDNAASLLLATIEGQQGLFRLETGVALRGLTFGGSSAALGDVVAGRTQLMFAFAAGRST